MNTHVNINKNFKLKSLNKQNSLKQKIATTTKFKLHP